jgi:hypothetical protein
MFVVGVVHASALKEEDKAPYLYELILGQINCCAPGNSCIWFVAGKDFADIGRELRIFLSKMLTIRVKH